MLEMQDSQGRMVEAEVKVVQVEEGEEVEAEEEVARLLQVLSAH